MYRSGAIPWGGRDVYYRCQRDEWLGKVKEAGVRRRAERLYEQLDMLQHLRQQARRELLAESRRHSITAKLRQIPSLGPIRSALAVALIQTPNRCGCQRQFHALKRTFSTGTRNPRLESSSQAAWNTSVRWRNFAPRKDLQPNNDLWSVLNTS